MWIGAKEDAIQSITEEAALKGMPASANCAEEFSVSEWLSPLPKLVISTPFSFIKEGIWKKGSC